MLVNIVNEQVRQGLNVSVIIINDLVAEELCSKIDSQVKVVRINRKVGSWGLDFIKQINHSIDLLHPDIIHFHRSEIICFIKRKWTCKSCCLTLHDMPGGSVGMTWHWGSFIQWLINPHQGNVFCINRFSRVFAISHAVAQALNDKYGIQSTVIPNGIAVNAFLPHRKRKDNRIFRIVQVSRLMHEKKGQDVLIEAAAILRDQGVRNLDVTFIGGGESLDYLKSMVSTRNLDNCVHFLGSKEQSYIVEHLKDYDLFVQPSRYEGFGLTVAEAMAACLPVLVSYGQGPAEVTENNRFGWVFDNGDAADLAAKIDYIMRNEEDVMAKVEGARTMVETRYDVSITAKRYIEEYDKIRKEQYHI